MANENDPDDLTTISGGPQLAALNALLDADHITDTGGKLAAVREGVRTLARLIITSAGSCPERENAINDLVRVYEQAKIARFR